MQTQRKRTSEFINYILRVLKIFLIYQEGIKRSKFLSIDSKCLTFDFPNYTVVIEGNL